MPCRWRSRSNSAALAGLALALAACGYTLVSGQTFPLSVIVDDASGAVLRAVIEGTRDGDELDARISARLVHTGAAPCHVAIYAHAERPGPEDIPVLTGPPAPAGPGELLFETVLLPPKGGTTFAREIGAIDELFGGLGGLEYTIPTQPGTSGSYFTITTCADPDIRIDLWLDLGAARERGEDGWDFSADVLWPQPP